MLYYSKSTGGFYDTEIHGNKMPIDVVEISSETHLDLLTAQANGKIIQADENGKPVYVDPPEPSQEQIILKQIKDLEQQQTPRRLRDAILTQDGDVWLSDIEHQIAQLRAQL